MTADNDTHARSDNSGSSEHSWRTDPDAQLITDLLADAGGTLSVAELLEYTQLSKPRLDALLARLDAADVIEVRQGFAQVRVDLQKHLRADGGVVESSADAHDIDIDVSTRQCCMVLAHPRRRLLIRLLADHCEERAADYHEVRDLAAAIASLETALRPDETAHVDEHQAYVALVQSHLDQLAACDLIEYYDRPQKVGICDALVAVADLLAVIDDVTEGTEWPPLAKEVLE